MGDLSSSRVAVVTGAVQGIGRAVALTLADAGFHVVATGRRDDERLEALGRELETAPRHGRAVVSDVADADAAKELYRMIFSDLGRLDVLVSNAGRLGDARVGMISDALLEETLAVNLTGAIRHMQAAARLMQRGEGGSIIAIGSIMGLRGNAGQVPYSAAKSGLVGAVRSMAKELGPAGIRANVVAPGFIETDLVADLDATVRADRLEAIPLGRAGTPDDVASLVAFLASDAAAYISGQVIGVDGAMVV